MEMEFNLRGSSTLTLVATVFLMLDLYLIRRRSLARWSMILAAVGVIVMYDIFSLAIQAFVNLSLVFVLIFIGFEEFAKFTACRLVGLHKPVVRFMMGSVFGLVEVALSKTQIILFGGVGPTSIALFVAFCGMAVFMHGVTALYYTIVRNSILGVFAATAIHAVYNGIVSQAEQGTIGLGQMALCELLLLTFALVGYLAIWRYDHRASA